MNIASDTLADAEQRRLGPALLMPSAVSLLAALLAWALATSGVSSGWPLGLVTAVQALLLLFGAAVIAGTQAAALNLWQRRVAPSAALGRVRHALLVLLAHLAARAAVGPLLLAAGLAWLRPGWAVAGMAAAALLVLTAALLAGAALGLRWQGRSPGWTLGARAPLPPIERTWGRWGLGWRRWRRVPTQEEVDMPWRGGSLWTWLAVLPQALIQGQHWQSHAWGRPLPGGWGVAWAGLWVAMLAMLASTMTLGPPLHWRARLAPGGLAPPAWARRMVKGSLLSGGAWASAVLALSMAVSDRALRAAQIEAWLPVLADVALAMTWTLWLRGLRNSGASQFLGALALGAGTMLLLGAAAALGLTLHRGAALLAVELLLTVTLAVAAQQAWARQDLNRLTPLH